MCELFAMSSRLPSTVALSMKTFAEHGGGTAPHRDGWGIAYYRDAYAQLIKDDSAAYDSDWVRFVQARGLRSSTIISHIRQATRGAVRLENTHPFARELGGKMHILAHNGTLVGVHEHPDFKLGAYRSIGDTDSEHAFCHLLDRMSGIWLDRAEPPTLTQRLEIFADFATRARALGSANFIYGDSEYLFLQAHERHHEDGETRPPGLHALTRQCREPAETVTGGGVAVTGEDNQAVTLFASVPLTDEDWVPLPKNTILALKDGEVVARG